MVRRSIPSARADLGDPVYIDLKGKLLKCYVPHSGCLWGRGQCVDGMVVPSWVCSTCENSLSCVNTMNDMAAFLGVSHTSVKCLRNKYCLEAIN